MLQAQSTVQPSHRTGHNFISCETDLSREQLIELFKRKDSYGKHHELQKVIENWDRYGGFKQVIDTILLETLFFPAQLESKLFMCTNVIDSTVDRYFLLQHLIEQGVIDLANLRNESIDIASFLGAAVDAIAMYGGNVVGVDYGKFAYVSPSERPISVMEGRYYLESRVRQKRLASFVSCFNIDLADESNEFADSLLDYALRSLLPQGQVLFTFDSDYMEGAGKLLSFPGSRLIEIPDGRNRRETYVFVVTRKL